MTVSQPLNKVKSYFMFFTSIQQKTTKHFSSIKTLAPLHKLIKQIIIFIQNTPVTKVKQTLILYVCS